MGPFGALAPLEEGAIFAHFVGRRVGGGSRIKLRVGGVGDWDDRGGDRSAAASAYRAPIARLVRGCDADGMVVLVERRMEGRCVGG